MRWSATIVAKKNWPLKSPWTFQRAPPPRSSGQGYTWIYAATKKTLLLIHFKVECGATLYSEESPSKTEAAMMAQIYMRLSRVVWGLGMASLLASVVLKAVPRWADKLSTPPHGILVFAAVLFLCSLATREVQRTVPPSS